MKFDTFKISTEPDFPVRAAGFEQTEPVDHARDPLYARSFVFEQDGERFVHIVIDALQAPQALRLRLQAHLEEVWNCPVHLVMGAIHTHYAPDMRLQEVQDYIYKRLCTMLDSVCLTERDLSCSYHYEYFDQIGKSRISHWTTDQLFAHVLSFYDGEKRIASYVIHSCHPTCMPGETDFFTSEFPGYAVRELEKRYPQEFFMYLQSATGDISTRFTRQERTYRQMETFGMKMADEFDRLLKMEGEHSPVTLGYTEVHVPLQHDLKDASSYVIPDYFTQRERETFEHGLRRSMNNLKNRDQLKKESIFAALKIGPYRLVFSEHELFSEYIKACIPGKGILVCYSQGYSHYVAGPSFDGLTYESLQDTLDDATRVKFMETIHELSE